MSTVTQTGQDYGWAKVDPTRVKKQCGDCLYFTATLSKHSAMKPQPGVGECRRYAPRGPVSLGWAYTGKDAGEHHAAIMSAFPFVPQDDWCGEFKDRRE